MSGRVNAFPPEAEQGSRIFLNKYYQGVFPVLIRNQMQGILIPASVAEELAGKEDGDFERVLGFLNNTWPRPHFQSKGKEGERGS